MVKIKLCGVQTEEDVHLMNKYRPDYIGFILAPSKRRVSIQKVRKLAPLVAKDIQKVGVFVRAPKNEILSFVREGLIDCIQLHGDETKYYIQELKKSLSGIGKDDIPLIQAIRVKEKEDIERANESIADYVLLDKYHKASYGGEGESFDWSLLKGIKRPYFLAGGVGEENVKKAFSLGPYAVDLSSKIEKNGKKDEALVRAFMQACLKAV